MKSCLKHEAKRCVLCVLAMISIGLDLLSPQPTWAQASVEFTELTFDRRDVDRNEVNGDEFIADLVEVDDVMSAPVASLQPGDHYVALGSSFASGSGVAPIADVGCRRSLNSYAHIVADALGLNLDVAACGGATIDNVVSVPQTDLLGAERPVQIDALNEHTKLVTVTVGGNDWGYVVNLMIASCQAAEGRYELTDGLDILCNDFGLGSVPIDYEASINALIPIQEELEQMILAIRERSPNAEIVVVDYTSILSRRGESCGLDQPLEGAETGFFLFASRYFGRATRKAAESTGATLVRLSKASRNHHVCSSEPWVSAFEFEPGFVGVVPYHPNAEGMEEAARLVLEAL